MDAGGQNLDTAGRNAGAELGSDKILVVSGVSKQFGGTQVRPAQHACAPVS